MPDVKPVITIESIQQIEPMLNITILHHQKGGQDPLYFNNKDPVLSCGGFYQ